MGVADRIVFAGYRTDDYVSVLGAMDFMVYLVPGSDGSCRAAREAMAIGKPVIAARRGLLPELVEDGLCGLVIDDTPRNLAEAILRLAEDAELRRRLGSAAARKAAEKFRIETQVEAVLALYRALTGLG
jgi:glycosyltransferase involved in cell wall biosynthesis